MVDEDSLRRGSAVRERQRVILLCAPVTLLFTFADVLALKRFAPLVFGVRLLWAVSIAAVGWWLPRATAAGERRLMTALGVSTPLFFGLLTEMTGGYGSPLFHFILAMPLIIAVVVQEHPRATLCAGIAAVASGIFITLRAGQSAQLISQWVIQAAAMSALAVYASVTYRRLRFREQGLREASAVATERARAADEAVRARDEFLSVASHELRTPLAALRLQIERGLRRPGGIGPESAPNNSSSGSASTTGTRDALESIHRQVDRMGALMENLLDVSRLAAPEPTLDRVETDLSVLIRQIAARYGGIAQAQGCALTVKTKAEVRVHVDPQRFEQVITNLLSNAVKYGAGQPVVVTVGAEGGTAVVSVRDQGIGIAAEDQVRIFERFERAASSRNYGGLGLGLWICKRLMELQGGRIRVTSRPNEGSTFTVELPLLAPSDEREISPAPAAE